MPDRIDAETCFELLRHGEPSVEVVTAGGWMIH